MRTANGSNTVNIIVGAHGKLSYLDVWCVRYSIQEGLLTIWMDDPMEGNDIVHIIPMKLVQNIITIKSQT